MQIERSINTDPWSFQGCDRVSSKRNIIKHSLSTGHTLLALYHTVEYFLKSIKHFYFCQISTLRNAFGCITHLYLYQDKSALIRMLSTPTCLTISSIPIRIALSSSMPSEPMWVPGTATLRGSSRPLGTERSSSRGP
jgi:hypothetical protein